MAAKKKKKAKPGPEAEHIKIEGDWRESVRKALEKPRPQSGWPKTDSRDRLKKKRF
jgi:hypothetical protein